MESVKIKAKELHVGLSLVDYVIYPQEDRVAILKPVWVVLGWNRWVSGRQGMGASSSLVE